MNIYMLNLKFDSTNSTETNNASFLPFITPAPANVLTQSKVWLTANTTTPDYDNPASWSNPAEDTGLLTMGTGDQIAIRIFSATAVTNFVGKLTVMLSRDTRRAWRAEGQKPLQTHGSPFPIIPNGAQSLVIFRSAAWVAPSAAAGSWWLNLGAATITTPPPDPKPTGFHDSYSVIAAITAGPGNTTSGPTWFYTYTHDPNMDVNC